MAGEASAETDMAAEETEVFSKEESEEPEVTLDEDEKEESEEPDVALEEKEKKEFEQPDVAVDEVKEFEHTSDQIADKIDDDDDDVAIIEETANPKKITKTDEDFFNSVSEEEQDFYAKNAISQSEVEAMKIYCTACSKQLNIQMGFPAYRHPDLGVALCRTCRHFYDDDDGGWEKDEEGYFCYCRWCANGGDLLCCDACSNAFCKRCLKKNLGRAAFTEIEESENWKCLVCDPKPIFSQRCLMYSIVVWKRNKKPKPEKKSKTAKGKKDALNLSLATIDGANGDANDEDFLIKNMSRAISLFQLCQKHLEDMKKKCLKNKKSNTEDKKALQLGKNMRKIYSKAISSLEALDASLVESFSVHHPNERASLVSSSPGLVAKVSGERRPKSKANGKKTSNVVRPDDEEISIEEIVVHGSPVFGANDYLDPSQLCSIEITDDDGALTPKQKTTKRPPAFRLSNSIFKKKQKLDSSSTNEVQEIVLDDDEAADDSDVSLEVE